MPAPQAHQALMEEIARLEDLAREWIGLFPQAAIQGQHWQKVLSQVQAHVAEDTCRLAVVGAVKSGKSTMINALVGQDLLRRGAGILTAMVTRVQPGPEAAGGAPVQGVGRDQRGNPPGPGASAQSPAGGPGRAPGPAGGPGPGTPGPGPGRGPGGRPLDRRQPGSELPAAQILPGGL